MEKPKFEVGEKIALKSILRPDLNTRRATVTKSEYTLDGTCGILSLPYTGWVYRVSTNNKPWCESALRKLPKKGEDGFNRMMSRLKNPKVVDRSKAGVIEIKIEEEAVIESN